MSGLNQRFTKPSGLNRPREFESHILRKMKSAKAVFHFVEDSTTPACRACEIRTAEACFVSRQISRAGAQTFPSV